jgi:hypothetical protein
VHCLARVPDVARRRTAGTAGRRRRGRARVGWGDVYEWNGSRQYAGFPVDVAGRPVPGDYVLVGTADPDQLIRETDERDNSSYAVFTVTSDRVVLRERGYGLGPHDPHRRPVTSAP